MQPKIEYLAEHPRVIPILANWHYQQWGHWSPDRTVGDRIQRLQTHLRRRQVPTTFVAFSGETLLGSASLVMNDLEARKDLCPWLASVFVAPQHRGKGVGGALILRVGDEARSLGFKTLYLFTSDQEMYYASRGWSAFERSVHKNDPIVLMALDLQQEAARPD